MNIGIIYCEGVAEEASPIRPFWGRTGDGALRRSAAQVFALLLLAALMASPPFATLHALEADRPARAIVISGDTIDIDGQRLRLFGIDAPEPSQWCGDESDIAYRCGWEATFFLAEIFEGRTVECVDTEAYQNFQRAVRCYFEDEERDRIDINATMVRAGHALAYRRYSDEFAEHEQTARAARRGMWRGAFQAPWDWRRLN